MQMTIEIPEKLARQLEPEREHLAEILEGQLVPAEAAEMDEIAELDQMVSLIKAEARLHLRAAS